MTETACNTVFELENVSYSYPGGGVVLKNVGFTVHRGERICILGANGCGKSTLLKLLSGLVFPDEGTFRAFGCAVARHDWDDDAFSGNYHRRVGFIFQNADVQLFCSTVEDEIAFGLLQQSLPEQTVRGRIGEIAALLGIEALLDKTPYKLSGGEKKKVALASVLVMNPEVLILDEPTNGLDPRTQVWLVRLLEALSGAGKTILASTHNLELVSRISDRGILFSEDHRIAADGPIAELLANAALLKSVNLVDEFYSG